VTAGLQGTGTAAPRLTLSPAGYDFGTVLVGSSSAPHTFTVGNPGAREVSLSAATTTGPFSVHHDVLHVARALREPATAT
jgi:hypothetical protein